MMKSVLTLICLSSFSHLAHGQILVGNGGDVVRCNDDGSTFSGVYALDYVATYDHGNQNSDIVTLPLEQQLDRIEHQLLYKAIHYWKSFRVFRANILSRSLSGSYIWRGAPHGLFPIDDEQLARRLPPNCTTDGPDARQVVQAFVQESFNGKVVLHYDSLIYRQLDAIPNQVSFLLIHEWLWHFAPNAPAIREVNRLFHSNDLEQMDSGELQLILEQFGMNPLPIPLRQHYSGERTISVFPDSDGRPTTSATRMILSNSNPNWLYSIRIYNLMPEPLDLGCYLVLGCDELEPGSPQEPFASLPATTERNGRITIIRRGEPTGHQIEFEWQ